MNVLMFDDDAGCKALVRMALLAIVPSAHFSSACNLENAPTAFENPEIDIIVVDGSLEENGDGYRCVMEEIERRKNLSTEGKSKLPTLILYSSEEYQIPGGLQYIDKKGYEVDNLVHTIAERVTCSVLAES